MWHGCPFLGAADRIKGEKECDMAVLWLKNRGTGGNTSVSRDVAPVKACGQIGLRLIFDIPQVMLSLKCQSKNVSNSFTTDYST